MGLSKEKRLKLSSIARGVRSHNFFKKLFWFIPAIYYGGVLRERYQKWFAKKMHWREKNLTVCNALTFGLATSVLYFYFGYQALGALSSYLVSGIAAVFHMTFKGAFYFYVWFNLFQNLGRVVYAEKTGKGIVSFSAMGAMLNIVHWSGHLFHRHVVKGIRKR